MPISWRKFYINLRVRHKKETWIPARAGMTLMFWRIKISFRIADKLLESLPKSKNTYKSELENN